jgi:hypothetical protein
MSNNRKIKIKNFGWGGETGSGWGGGRGSKLRQYSLVFIYVIETFCIVIVAKKKTSQMWQKKNNSSLQKCVAGF